MRYRDEPKYPAGYRPCPHGITRPFDPQTAKIVRCPNCWEELRTRWAWYVWFRFVENMAIA